MDGGNFLNFKFFRVPSNKELVDRTVPSTKSLLDGCVPSTNSLLDGTLKKVKVLISFPTTSKPPLVRPQKCQSFVQKLRGTLFPEGNQLSVNWVL